MLTMVRWRLPHPHPHALRRMPRLRRNRNKTSHLLYQFDANPARPVENIDAAAPQPDLPPRVQPQLPRREVHPSPSAMGQDEETDRGTKPDVHQDAEPAPEDEEEHSSDDSSSSGENLPQGARSSQKPRRAGHGSQRFKNKGQKSDVKSLWRQLGMGGQTPMAQLATRSPLHPERGEAPLAAASQAAGP